MTNNVSNEELRLRKLYESMREKYRLAIERSKTATDAERMCYIVEACSYSDASAMVMREIMKYRREIKSQVSDCDMIKWIKPSEALPECDCGDRVIGIVRYRECKRERVLPHVVVLVAEENGWRDVEDGGFDIHDCELWILERDLVKIAEGDQC